MSLEVTRRRALQMALAATAGLAGCQQQAPTPTAAVAAAKDPPAAPQPAFVKNEVLLLVYPKFTALDLIGPQHVFSLLGPEFKTRLVWKNKEPLISDTGIPVTPTLAFRDCPASPTVLFVPGGTDGTVAALEDPEVREFIASVGKRSQYVTSVCTGALILGVAGLLKDYKATTHWLALESLSKFGAKPVAERVVIDRNRITAGGVTAGIDFALTLAAKLKDESYAKAVQLMMEYDPKPPFHSGNPTVADPESVKLLRAMAVPFHKNLDEAIERINASAKL